MLIGASEGQAWRYEIVDYAEGFLVRTRDLDTGEVEDSASRWYRTAAVAFAYAELSASFDRFAAARVGGEAAAEGLHTELELQEALYADLSERLGDKGLAAEMLLAWEQQEAARDRGRLH